MSLYNLLYDESCHEEMVEEGILWSFAAICKSSSNIPHDISTLDVELSRMCSTTFCNLSCSFSAPFLSSMASVKSLLMQTLSSDKVTKMNSSQALFNILTKISEETIEIAELSVKYLKELSYGFPDSDSDSESSHQLKIVNILSFCIVSQFPACRSAIRNLSCLNKIDFSVARQDNEIAYAYAATVCNMSKDPECLVCVMDDVILSALIQLCLSTEERTVTIVAKTLYNCTTDVSYIER